MLDENLRELALPGTSVECLCVIMALSLQYWVNYTSGSSKLSRKSENAVDANRVLKFVFDRDLQYVVGHVQASMRDRSYKVEVGIV